MKQKATRDVSAFTRIELIVVIVLTIVLGFVTVSLLQPPRRVHSSANRVSCLNNLKEIGTAYRLWAEENGDRTPAGQTVAKGGWGDFLTNADQGALCWTNYAIMQNELGQSPKLVNCPSDERPSAISFTNNFDNTHLSYFVGVSANEAHPQSLMGGDRNLGPGTKPDPDYGFSPASGKGNDVAIPISGPVAWSLKIHSAGKTAGAGNILLGDGSGQLIGRVPTSSTLPYRAKFQPFTDATTNWPAGHVPAAPSIRLVFP
jgi:type II secretory pathway pseudopilin PulG